ncbi:peptidoglycan DD-metalloendopeptidase family protein [Nocardioides psychrotolerans]|uniref:peptidoglycan DD-metalloendopeptidase family protein n=1 Tax=Nocardioides psychrotolerans TaxID=1005945 RepID=UPI00116083F4|nr:M23 family metallopeptidase [Nocardioides psychrotolerans]
MASLATAATLGGLAIPLANADDGLKDKQKRVEQQIEAAHDDLGEASKRVQRTTAALEVARTKLVGAKAGLDDVRARLADAQARDREMQAKLVLAEEALEQARADVLAGQAALAAQRVMVVNTVNDVYENGDPQLLAFASLMEADSPEDLMRRMEATDAVVGSQDRAYAGLHEAEILLRVREGEVETAQQEMETRRADAAANLAMVRDLLEEARVARANVISLLQTNRDAREKALAARAKDKQVLATLKRREDRIKARIIAEAEAAARRGGGYQGDTGGLLTAPVNGYVTSPFGYRVHPIYGYYGLHDGTDFGVSCGQSLFAVAGGTVTDIYYSSVYGNRLYLSLGQVNGKNMTVVYNHAAGYRVGEGEQVARGEVVGYAGDTGWSTGCHLHFTVLVNGEPVDPMNFI